MNKPTKIIITLAMTYEALAHIIVGILIGGWILAEQKRPYWIMLLLITAIEIICALRQ